jgi:hypothetical protein
VALLAVQVSASGVLAQEGPTDGKNGKSGAVDQELLLDGVRAFRSEKYEEALRLFRRIESEQQPADIGFYVGTTLHKLGRHLEAVVAFRAARRAGLREPVVDYYLSVSCYRLGMLARARRGFAALVVPAAQPAPSDGADAPVLGPRLQQGAQRFLAAVDQALVDSAPATAPRPGLLARRQEAARLEAESQLAAGNDAAALEWLDEAAQLLVGLPERNEKLPALRQQLSRLRAGPYGKSAEADLLAIEALLATG